MRINFNSNKSMFIWGIIWCITAAISSGYEFTIVCNTSYLLDFLGSAITDLIVDKDWYGLKRFLIKQRL